MVERGWEGRSKCASEDSYDFETLKLEIERVRDR